MILRLVITKDDQVVAKVLGRVPPPRHSGLKIAVLCLCAIALLAGTVYVVVLRPNTPLASASAAAKPAEESAAPAPSRTALSAASHHVLERGGHVVLTGTP